MALAPPVALAPATLEVPAVVAALLEPPVALPPPTPKLVLPPIEASPAAPPVPKDPPVAQGMEVPPATVLPTHVSLAGLPLHPNDIPTVIANMPQTRIRVI